MNHVNFGYFVVLYAIMNLKEILEYTCELCRKKSRIIVYRKTEFFKII